MNNTEYALCKAAAAAFGDHDKETGKELLKILEDRLTSKDKPEAEPLDTSVTISPAQHAPSTGDRRLTVAEAAKIAKCSVSAITAAIASGDLKAEHVGGTKRKTHLVIEKDLHQFIASRPRLAKRHGGAWRRL